MDGFCNEESGLLCCFCNKDTGVSDVNPCDISIINHVKESPDDRMSQFFGCHFECFKNALHKDIQPQLFADLKTCTINRNYNLPTSLQCAGCNTDIGEQNACDTSFKTNWLDKWPKGKNQTFLFHFECLKSKLDPYMQGYLVIGEPEQLETDESEMSF